jgi:hypothetical protein
LPKDIPVEFFHPIHASHARAAPQSSSHGLHLLRAANGVNFHAPVEKISHVSADTRAGCCSLGEKAKPHALHSAGYKKSLGVRFHGNTSRSDFVFAAARL